MPETYWVVVTILGMAAVTALTRFAGCWVVGHIEVKGRVAGALEAVPGSVLIAIVTPAALAAGPAEAIAAGVTLVAAWRAPTLVAVLSGVAAVILMRHLLG